MALTFRLKLVHDPAGKVSSIGLLASGGRHGSLGFLGAEEMGRATRLLRNLWQALGSIQLAATLLAVLLLASLLASLFPQMPADPSAHESWLAAVALRYGPVTQLLHALDLFDAYRAPWFLALLALVCGACSLAHHLLSGPMPFIRALSIVLAGSSLLWGREWPQPGRHWRAGVTACVLNTVAEPSIFMPSGAGGGGSAPW